MGARQKEWARKARVELMSTLGAVCVACGDRENLTFDCKTPCGHAHHRKEFSARVSFYRAQHRNGNLQVLCAPCNSAKGDRQDDDFKKAMEGVKPF